jgi:hypothetical protein
MISLRPDIQIQEGYLKIEYKYFLPYRFQLTLHNLTSILFKELLQGISKVLKHSLNAKMSSPSTTLQNSYN